MLDRDELIRFLADYLDIAAFEDYAPNGLQVEGRAQIGRLVTGVTASQALIEAAIERRADAILVHHGYFWKGEDPRVTGMKRNRLKALLAHDINLLAYHLPLDAHPEVGNNRQLADVIGITPTAAFGAVDLGRIGELADPMSGEAFARHLETTLGRAPLHVPGPQAEIGRIAWCTGGAQGYIEAAAEQGVDAYLTGEVSEQTVHVAREMGLHFYAAGHHATERYGARALGEYLAKKFSLHVEFIDIDNPA